jgi:hypothetical protein
MIRASIDKPEVERLAARSGVLTISRQAVLEG